MASQLPCRMRLHQVGKESFSGLSFGGLRLEPKEAVLPCEIEALGQRHCNTPNRAQERQRKSAAPLALF